MKMNIVTISRECGSGGHSIGKMLAEKIGTAFFDKEIIKLVAEKSDFAESFIEEQGELITGGIFSHNIILGDKAFHTFTSPQDQINNIQVELINELASKGPCVIVGRGADFILRDREDCLNVFIRSDMEHKVERSIKEHELDPKKAESILLKRDKARANHYNYYTQQVWGDEKNYHMILDSGKLGIEKCVDIIAEAVK